MEDIGDDFGEKVKQVIYKKQFIDLFAFNDKCDKFSLYIDKLKKKYIDDPKKSKLVVAENNNKFFTKNKLYDIVYILKAF
jgi:hypothetical protein